MSDITDRDIKILAAIKAVRLEHWACTAGLLATTLRTKKSTLVPWLHDLKKRKLIEFSSVPGSIHLTALGGKAAAKAPKLETARSAKSAARSFAPARKGLGPKPQPLGAP